MQRALASSLFATIMLAAGLRAVSGCSSEGRLPAAGDAGSSARGDGAAGGGDGSAAGSPSESSGGDAATEAGNGSGANAGEASIGSGGEGTAGGAPPIPEGPFMGPDPFPCSSDATQVPPDLETNCAPSADWGAPSAVASPASPGAILLGITPDELTLAWSEVTGSVRLHCVAYRASASDRFGEAQSLRNVQALSISPDGLRIAASPRDQSALFVLTRADRTGLFGTEAEGEFSLIDAHARENGWSFSSCVFAPDDRTLFYTAGGPDSKHLLHVAERADNGPWSVGTLIEQCELEVHGGYGRYPTAVSADGQTLFFYDSWRGVMRAAWREPRTSTLRWFQDLGQRFGARPNAACDRLYFSLPGEASAILSAPRQ